MTTNHKIRLNFAAATLSVLPGVIAIPAMIPESIAGSSMYHRKAIYLTDIDLALLCGIKADEIRAKPSVLLDYADLPSRSVGLQFLSHTALSSHIDFENNDPTIDPSVHDVGTVIFELSKPKALEFGFTADDIVDNDTVTTAIRGVSADLVADMAGPAASLNLSKSTVGAFFGTVSELMEEALIAHHANSHDKSPDALKADTEAAHAAS